MTEKVGYRIPPIVFAVSVCPYCKGAKPYMNRVESLGSCVKCKRVYMVRPQNKQNWMKYEDYEKMIKEQLNKKTKRGTHPNSIKNLKQNREKNEI